MSMLKDHGSYSHFNHWVILFYIFSNSYTYQFYVDVLVIMLKELIIIIIIIIVLVLDVIMKITCI